MALKIRPACEADAAGILAVYTPYILNTAITFEYEVPAYEQFLARFRSSAAQFAYLVCEDEGEIVGYAYAGLPFERAAYRWNASLSVYVKEEYHGRRIGSALYGAVTGLLRAQGYRNVYAIITGYNDSSLKFHTALGFKEFARFKNSGFKLGKWYDVIWMEKELNPYPAAPPAPRRIGEIEEEIIAAALLQANRLLKQN